jgi:hypothetical protein
VSIPVLRIRSINRYLACRENARWKFLTKHLF